MKGWQLVALVLLADGCVGGGCNPEEIPENDVCTEPGPAPDSVEIGVYLGQDEGYLALADSDVMEAVTGGQGTDMLRLMLRMEGSRLGCVEQVTTVSQLTGEPNQWSVARPLQVYEDESDGIFYTNPTFVILDFPPPEDGDLLLVETMAGAAQAGVEVFYEQRGNVVLRSLEPDRASVPYEEPVLFTLALVRSQEQDIAVSLTSSGRLQTPDSVVVPAGEVTVTFEATQAAYYPSHSACAVFGDEQVCGGFEVIY